MYRNPKLLRAARGQSCMIRIPDICNGDNATTVAAHSNQLKHGKGTGIKAHDCFIAWACSDCHKEIDQGKRLDKTEKQHYWQTGFERTLLAMLEVGIIVVA
jgi:ferredoxin